MTPLVIVIDGAPRTKKTSNQILRFGGRLKVNPSPQFLAYQEQALWQLDAFSRRSWVPIAHPVSVEARFYRDRNTGDLIGYMQALADVLEKARVLSNDRMIESWDGTRLDKDAVRPRVEVTVRAYVPKAPVSGRVARTWAELALAVEEGDR